MSDEMISMLADAAAAFARPDPRRVRALRGSAEGFDRTVWRQMAELGWLSIGVPEAAGGLGLNLAAATTVATRLGHAGFPEPYVAAAVMAPWCLAQADAGSCGPAVLAEVLTGECVAAPAWQNDQGSLDPEQTAVVAQQDGDHAVLSGSCRFVLPASADGFLVAARAPAGLALCWVPRDQPGLVIDTEPCADGSSQARLHFSALRLPASHCLAGAPLAGPLLRDMLDRGTVAASAELVGLMDRALEMTLDYLRTRRQFGKPIGSFQALQHRAVDIWIQRQLARAAVDAAVRTLDSPTSTATARQQAASSAKSRASHAALMLCTQAVQLHGAIGFTDEYDLGLYLNRALNLSAWLGNAAEHRRRYGALAHLSAASAT
jgi:alkylation response protein AidB-like acyl-CoA dehydrogenase